ncbi:hypothetical protein BO71DRAFT_42488 [Aspergillus ellipticus CBS 707.79]|uniref:Uncharacterized protein n=1 Tax=Aspergillus ellipticus CBS 707.79 TaxID=1448320 RepID=A0A319DKB4_9EURO|nr:hypothetical protein BO71DRAFT_42488 [Aspergillus ellipticus CBS 707.79]
MYLLLPYLLLTTYYLPYLTYLMNLFTLHTVFFFCVLSTWSGVPACPSQPSFRGTNGLMPRCGCGHPGVLCLGHVVPDGEYEGGGVWVAGGIKDAHRAWTKIGTVILTLLTVSLLLLLSHFPFFPLPLPRLIWSSQGCRVLNFQTYIPLSIPFTSCILVYSTTSKKQQTKLYRPVS